MDPSEKTMTPNVARIIIFATAVCLQLGCNRSPSTAGSAAQGARFVSTNCSTEMLELLGNVGIQARVGVNLTQGGGLGLAYTYDSRGAITGAAYLLADVCGPASHPSTKAFHIVYLPGETK